MSGGALALLGREDVVRALDLAGVPAGMAAAAFRRLQMLRDERRFESSGSMVFSKSLALHARLLDPRGGLPLAGGLPEEQSSPVERKHQEAVREHFAQVRSRLRSAASPDSALDNLMAVVPQVADWLHDHLPPAHPLCVKDGRYVWTDRRTVTVRRLLKSVVCRLDGFRGVGGVCAALSDCPGSGKTLTLKLVATVCALVLDRTCPFYYDLRDGPLPVSTLYRVAYSFRTGEKLPQHCRIFHSDERNHHLIGLAFLDSADVLWRPGEPPESPRVGAAREIYYVGAHPGAGAAFLAGPSHRLSDIVRDEETRQRPANSAAPGAYPAGLGADQFELLRLGAMRSVSDLRRLLESIGSDGSAPRTQVERALAAPDDVLYRTSGVPRRVQSYLIDPATAEPAELVPLPPDDSLEMALVLALYDKAARLRRRGVRGRAELSESEALGVSRAYYGNVSRRGTSGAVAHGQPPHVVSVLRKMEDRYQLCEDPAGSGRWRFYFESLCDRLNNLSAGTLLPLARQAPALFLDPFWRRGPEALLREAFSARRVVFVLGAGCSLATAPSTAPSWRQLIDRAAERALAPEAREQVRAILERAATSSRPQALLTRAATMVEDLADGPKLAAVFREELGGLRATNCELLEAIGATGVPILTCNYDNLLGDCLAHLGRRGAVWTDEELPDAAVLGGEPVDLYVHGRFDRPESIVFGSSSYRRVLSNARLQRLLRQLHRQARTLVYVGFGSGLRDPNFGRLLRWADDELRDAEFRQFMLMRESDAIRWAEESPRGDHQTAHTLPVVYGREYAELPEFIDRLRLGQSLAGSNVDSGRGQMPLSSPSSLPIELESPRR